MLEKWRDPLKYCFQYNDENRIICAVYVDKAIQQPKIHKSDEGLISDKMQNGCCGVQFEETVTTEITRVKFMLTS